jgi:hypothetical protein
VNTEGLSEYPFRPKGDELAMNTWNNMMESLAVLGLLAVRALPWVLGIVVGWRVMRALERIAAAMEVRPPTQA